MSEESAVAGRLSIDVVADTTGFGAALQAKIDQQTQKVKAKVQAEVASVKIDRAKIRSEVEAALKEATSGVNAPTVTIGVRVDRAQLQKELDEAAAAASASAKVKVDGDTSELHRAIEEEKAKAEASKVKVRVDADTSSASSSFFKLASEGAEAFTSLAKFPTLVAGIGALAGTVTNLAGALFSVASAGGGALGVLAGLPALASVGAQGLLTVVAGFGGIGQALKDYGASQKAAATSAAQSADQQSAATARVRAAQESLAQAQIASDRQRIQSSQQVADARARVAAAQQSAADSVARAEQQAADTRVQVADKVARAQDQLTRAAQDEASAQRDLVAAREDARRGLEDINFTLKRGILNEEGARYAIEEAKKRVEQVKSARYTDLDRAEADLALRKAKESLDEIEVRNKRLKGDVAKANAAGVEGSSQVVAAKNKIATAAAAEQAAEKNLADTRAQGAQEVRAADAQVARAKADGAAQVAKAQQALARTQQQTSWAQQDAARRVADAQRQVAEAQQKVAKGSDAARTAQEKYLQSLKQLGPEGARFVKFITDTLLPHWKQAQGAAREGLLPGVEDGLRRLDKTFFPRFKAGLKATGKVIGEVVQQAAKDAEHGPWSKHFNEIVDTNNKAIRNFGDGISHLIEGFGSLVHGSGPLLVQFSKDFDRWAKRVEKFLDKQDEIGSKDPSKGIQGFLSRSYERAKKVVHILGGLLGVIGDLGHSSMPAGDTFLDRMADSVDRLHKWTSSPDGQKKLQAFFDGTLEPTRQIMGLLKKVGEILGTLGRATGGNTLDGILGLFQSLADALLAISQVPHIGDILDKVLLIGGVGLGIAKVVGMFEKWGKAADKIMKLTGLKKGLSGLAGMFGFGKNKGGTNSAGQKTNSLATLGSRTNPMWVRWGPAALPVYISDLLDNYGDVDENGNSTKKKKGKHKKSGKSRNPFKRVASEVGDDLESSGGKHVRPGLLRRLGGGLAGRVGPLASDVGSIALPAAVAGGGGLLARLGGGIAKGGAGLLKGGFHLVGGLGGIASIAGGFAGDAIANGSKVGSGRSIFGRALSGASTGAGIGAMLGSVIPVVGNIAGGVLGGILGGLGGAVMGAGGIGKLTSTVGGWFSGIGGAISTGWKDVKKKVSDGWSDAWSGLKDMGGKVSGAFQSAWGKAGQITKDAWHGVTGAVEDGAGWVGDKTKAGLGKAKDIAKTTWGHVTEFFGSARDTITHTASQTWSNVKGGVEDKLGKARDRAKDVWQGTVDKFHTAGGDVKRFASDGWSKVQGTVDDARSGLAHVRDAAKQKWNDVTAHFRDSAPKIKGWAQDAWTKVGSTVNDGRSGLKAVGSWAKSKWNEVTTNFRDQGPKIKGWAQDAWNKVSSTISDPRGGLKAIVGVAKRLADDIAQGFATAKTHIQQWWAQGRNSVQSIVAAPVNWIGEHVYNDGIKWIWDKVAGAVGGKPLGQYHRFAKGGVMPGYAPGVDSLMAMVSPGEGILVPEAVRGLAKHLGMGAGDAIQHLNSMFSSRVPKPKYARGGVVEPGDEPRFGFGGWLSDRWKNVDSGWDAIKGGGAWVGSHLEDAFAKGADALKNVAMGATKGAASLAFKPVLALADHFLGGRKGGMFGLAKGGVHKLADTVLDYLGGKDKDAVSVPALMNGGRGGNVARWQSTVESVLRMLGVPLIATNGVLNMIAHESGGNPSAINLWDSNARAGHPSQGLMQTIPSTFRAYAGPYLQRGINDPLANIFAGVNYAIHRYGVNWLIGGGNRSAGGAYKGYSLGGLVQGFARGGVIPGVRTAADSTLIAARPGEGVLIPEAVDALGGATGIAAINRVFHAAQGSRRGLGAMAGQGGWHFEEGAVQVHNPAAEPASQSVHDRLNALAAFGFRAPKMA